MKIRAGFVSNSSSSSFICDMTGRDSSGWDLCLSEADMFMCVNGHTFDTQFLTIEEEVARKMYADGQRERYPEYANYDDEELQDDFEYEIPAELCPLCSFQNVSDRDAVAWLLKELDTDRKGLAEKLSAFGTYENFKNYIKG